jgi:protein SCO1/2
MPVRAVCRVLTTLLCLTCSAASLRAETFVAPRPAVPTERLEKGPKELDNVGIDEKLGGQVPLNLDFKESDGSRVTLGQIIDARRPAILTLNYSDCPMLCSLQLDGFSEGLRELKWTVGEEFDVITVSIDPKESIEHSRLFKEKYLTQYRRDAAKRGWHFLTGEQTQIEALAAAVGFKYTYVPERKEYAHTAAVMVLSPEGVVSRYLYGVQYAARDLKLALVEAAEGKVGSTVDRILLYCFHYDATTGKYTAVAQNIMRLTGAMTLLILGSAMGVFWMRDERRHRAKKIDPQ